MQKNQVKIGGTYLAKVTNKIVTVRIDREHANGGWTATNLSTHKSIRIKSAQRLRGPAKKKLTTKEREALLAQHKADQENARLRDQRETSEDGMAASERAMHESAELGAKGDEPDANTDKPMSLIDAAAHLLSLGTGDPMRCKEIVDLAVDRGLWTPGKGKTPANTLYNAILREINVKGDESRFVKTERGKFTLAGKAA